MLGAGFVDTKNAGTRVNTRMSGTGRMRAWHATWGTQIDYLLTKGMGGAKSFKVNSAAPRNVGSDHYPVTAVVNIPRSGAHSEDRWRHHRASVPLRPVTGRLQEPAW